VLGVDEDNELFVCAAPEHLHSRPVDRREDICVDAEVHERNVFPAVAIRLHLLLGIALQTGGSVVTLLVSEEDFEIRYEFEGPISVSNHAITGESSFRRFVSMRSRVCGCRAISGKMPASR